MPLMKSLLGTGKDIDYSTKIQYLVFCKSYCNVIIYMVGYLQDKDCFNSCALSSAKYLYSI